MAISTIMPPASQRGPYRVRLALEAVVKSMAMLRRLVPPILYSIQAI
jgi:hypothetical protein